MDRTQILLVGLPIFLFFSDIINLFAPPPDSPKPTHQHQHHHHHSIQPNPQSQPHLQQPLEFPKQSGIGLIGVGNTVNIDFCTSCSYKGTAVTDKNMLESAFPGINVVLANYPPPLPKRILSKVIPVAQTGIIAIIVAGEHIFPRLGMAPPPWYYSLHANKFRSIASTWLLANFLQSFLQSSGAFEVYCNGELVFSKLKENRFPGEIELRELVGRRLVDTRYVNGI
ncbi:selT-like protein isoform X2 [Gastrolobium bilobum]|uniref:selT-like protein isoform X2 n=1 Tax=Gastrolobium bilobum TaxID=150636 RepID=UPI002AB1F5A1|nr:selT-like protein isoform X2 [Gastrolobium bilobum]